MKEPMLTLMPMLMVLPTLMPMLMVLPTLMPMLTSKSLPQWHTFGSSAARVDPAPARRSGLVRVLPHGREDRKMRRAIGHTSDDEGREMCCSCLQTYNTEGICQQNGERGVCPEYRSNSRLINYPRVHG
jgi:hypothetical protein